MSIEYIRYRLAPAEVDHFVKAYERAATYLRDCEHVLSYELACATDGSGRCVVRIVWDSVEGHEAFTASDALEPFLGELGGFLDDIVEMRHYEPSRVSYVRGTSG